MGGKAPVPVQISNPEAQRKDCFGRSQSGVRQRQSHGRPGAADLTEWSECADVQQQHEKEVCGRETQDKDGGTGTGTQDMSTEKDN